jgi:hypothetical protein
MCGGKPSSGMNINISAVETHPTTTEAPIDAKTQRKNRATDRNTLII